MSSDPDAAIKAVHVALYRSGEAGAYGGGLLVAGDRVLTCAHVVNLALGRPQFAQQPPPERAGVVDGIVVALPGRAPGGGRFRVALESWLPGQSGDRAAQEGDHEWSGDLALLRIVDQLPGPSGVPPTELPLPGPATAGVALGQHRLGPSAFAWYGSGNPSTVAAVVVQAETGRWLVLDTPASAQPLVEGYSGTPLWDREQCRVVGLVVSRRRQRAFAIPTRVITEHFPWLHRSPADDPSAEASWQGLVESVRRLLPGPAARADHARELATELGLAPPVGGEPPAPEWFVLTALSAPHGTASLLALLADLAPSQTERSALQAQAVYAAPDELLTATEHRELLRLVAGLELRPGEVAARALPLGPGLEGVDWPGAVRILEGYRPRFGKVPSLLRVIEFAARETGDPDLGSALRVWNDALAKRLDLGAGLAEHRIQASEAARARAAHEETEPPLVQLQLWRSGSTENFGFAVRVLGPDGSVRHRICQDRPDSRAALLDVLAEVLVQVGRESEPGVVPRVECFVQKDELDLDLDQWVYRPDELFPSVLGQDFPVVLRCPELRRPEYLPELRYRWQARHTAGVLPQQQRDPEVQERGRASPVCGVVLCCPPAETGRLRVIAMAVGVPGVLWPRPVAAAGAAELLRELTSGVTVAGLPRAVYEARIRAGENGLGRHLALLWDGPERIPETLVLGDPQ
ncbi:trypsin-like peptidase domain-containing protein [Kitasatospora sp. NPDC002040]|uniref:VMAP-C domain-containing protein n=1 Tax=Kitasatospora sp. NPDC002040 TaxID=3154661 RepID=UPI003322902F